MLRRARGCNGEEDGETMVAMGAAGGKEGAVDYSEGGADGGESGGERVAEGGGGVDAVDEEVGGLTEGDEVERRVKMRRRYVVRVGGGGG